jgi:hypothetical protein
MKIQLFWDIWVESARCVNFQTKLYNKTQSDTTPPCILYQHITGLLCCNVLIQNTWRCCVWLCFIVYFCLKVDTSGWLNSNFFLRYATTSLGNRIVTFRRHRMWSRFLKLKVVPSFENVGNHLPSDRRHISYSSWVLYHRLLKFQDQREERVCSLYLSGWRKTPATGCSKLDN